ncbi:Arc family DNA-binding protein [Caballeronia novacaledonica]|uniref:Arc family DNA-binding protein n=1 Tax=Caballeronia novacaledonica TaxID=1544861 RepID=UPI001EE37ACA|nr:Arc family DNA-binding protein [Caballeronia novacaledonica]GJH13554.1 Arc family DNA-binding protein [Caballeronia novacaledonica]
MEDTHRSQYRLPWPLYEELKAAAEKNRRPLNAELIARLESTFPQLSVGADADVSTLHRTISQMSLAELMTPAEITMFAQRMLDIVNKKGGTDEAPQ